MKDKGQDINVPLNIISDSWDSIADRLSRRRASVHTGFGAHAAFYSMGNGGSFLIGQGAQHKVHTINFHLVPRLTMSAISPLSHIPSWHAQRSFTFILF